MSRGGRSFYQTYDEYDEEEWVGGAASEEEALVPEVREELGVEATPVAKVRECPMEGDGMPLHWWTAGIGPRELRPDPDEVADARWVTREEFLRLEPTFAEDRDFVARVLPTLGPAGSERTAP